MDDVLITLAIGCSATLFFSIPFATLVLIRYLRYRETVALAEQGLLRPASRYNQEGPSRWGVALTAIGAALTLGLWPIGFLVETPLGLGPWMIPGLLPLFFGIALLKMRRTEAPPTPQPTELPDPSLDSDLDWRIPSHKAEAEVE
ncbi:MAG: hypothetical protein KDE09_03230 [Anaerolineales bacterium]|nr:hypothetical protein [Anaerolineales bacterium]MCB0010268.1 hypothetical protein [Anaerolineales bacterium]MCB0016774.1 hypothetical protein [Anaerolineales bacterium]MCB8962831.1 hypothetical protein [Ardenticatenales bacterium]